MKNLDIIDQEKQERAAQAAALRADRLKRLQEEALDGLKDGVTVEGSEEQLYTRAQLAGAMAGFVDRFDNPSEQERKDAELEARENMLKSRAYLTEMFRDVTPREADCLLEILDGSDYDGFVRRVDKATSTGYALNHEFETRVKTNADLMLKGAFGLN